MMKTTLALATMVAVASAASISTKLTVDQVKALNSGDATTPVLPCADTLVTVSAASDVYAKKYIDVVELAGAADGDNVADCVAAIEDGTKGGDADAAAAPAACVSTTTFKFVSGADKACPLAFDATCTATQKCQADDGVADVACPAALKCPAKKVDEVFYLRTEVEFSENYKTAIAALPAAFNTALTAAFVTAKLEACRGAGVASWPTDKKGKTVVSISSTTVKCDPAAVKKVYEDAVTAYNKDKEGDAKVTYSVKKVAEEDAAVVAKCLVDDKAVCKTTTGCTYPCADAATCTQNSDCGSNQCVETTKVCASSAFSAVASAVVAAALAVAFF